MSKAEALATLKKMPQFKWKFDAYNTKSEEENSKEQMRIYVSSLTINGKGDYPSVLYLIWEKDKSEMASLVIYKDAAQYCIGDTKKLFTTAAIEPNASCTKFLKAKVVTEVGDYTTSYIYKQQHFKFVSYVDTDGSKDIWIDFID